jgi:hypothetical protein
VWDCGFEDIDDDNEDEPIIDKWYNEYNSKDGLWDSANEKVGSVPGSVTISVGREGFGCTDHIVEGAAGEVFEYAEVSNAGDAYISSANHGGRIDPNFTTISNISDDAISPDLREL